MSRLHGVRLGVYAERGLHGLAELLRPATAVAPVGPVVDRMSVVDPAVVDMLLRRTLLHLVIRGRRRRGVHLGGDDERRVRPARCLPVRPLPDDDVL